MGALFSTTVLAQQYPALDLLTPVQKAAIKLDQMSEQEKIVLNTVLADVLSKAYKAGQSKCGGEAAKAAPSTTPGRYPTGGGHWINTNGDVADQPY